jgi:hypothetical protein
MPETLESLSAKIEEMREALGLVCLAPDGSHHVIGPKLATLNLDRVEPNAREAIYMLAAFCFDLSRKMDYIFLALKAYAEKPFESDESRALARRIRDDYRAVYKPDASWEQAARVTEDVLRGVLKVVLEEHQRLLEARAR